MSRPSGGGLELTLLPQPGALAGAPDAERASAASNSAAFSTEPSSAAGAALAAQGLVGLVPLAPEEQQRGINVTACCCTCSDCYSLQLGICGISRTRRDGACAPLCGGASWWALLLLAEAILFAAMALANPRSMNLVLFKGEIDPQAYLAILDPDNSLDDDIHVIPGRPNVLREKSNWDPPVPRKFETAPDLVFTTDPACCAAESREWAAQHNAGHCIVPECLQFFDSNRDWEANMQDHSQFWQPSPQWRPPSSGNFSVVNWECSPADGDGANRGANRYDPCTVTLTDLDLAVAPGKPTLNAATTLSVPRLCTPDEFCDQLDEMEDAEIVYSQIVLLPVQCVLVALHRFLALRLFLRGSTAAASELGERAQEQLMASARKVGLLLWTPAIGFVLQYWIINQVICVDCLGTFWHTFNTFIYIVLGFGIAGGCMTTMSLGATTLMLRAQCLAHEERVDTAVEEMIAQPAAEQVPALLLEALGNEADALRESSRRWSGVLKVQIAIGVVGELIMLLQQSVPDPAGPGRDWMSLNFTVVCTVVLIMWPLVMSFRPIVQLNTLLADVPARLVRCRVFELSECVNFSLCPRGLFAAERACVCSAAAPHSSRTTAC